MTYTNPNQVVPPVIPGNSSTTTATSSTTTSAPVTTPVSSNPSALTTLSPQHINLSVSTQIKADDNLVKPIEGVENQTAPVVEGNVPPEIKEAEPNAQSSGPVEEPIPDDLSEISDDADEILNKDEEITEPTVEDTQNPDETSEDAKKAEVTGEDVSKNEQSQQAVPEVSDKISQDGNEEQTKIESTETKDINDDLLDFEEISDGELEEDAKTRNLGDALGVDWTSLVEESKIRGLTLDNQTTAKQRWQPHRVILDVGISLNLAGEEFAKKILQNAKTKLDEEESLKVELKLEETRGGEAEIKQEAEEIAPLPEIKKEIQEESEFDNLNTLACVQVGLKKKLEQKRNLVFNACGANSRALSARRDLRLRRQLCGLPVKEVGFEPPVNDHLKALAIKAFQKAVGEVK